MSDFRDRLGAELGAAAARLSAPEADFRDRLGVQLTAAAAELCPGLVPVATDAAHRSGNLVPDFRDRLGVQFAAAAGTLAAGRRAGAGAPARPRLVARPATQPGDFRARLGVQLAASAGMLAEERARSRGARRRARVGTWGAALLPRLARPLAVGVALTGLAGAATASSLWLAPVGKPDSAVNPGLSATPPPSAQLAAFAVLRSPQTAADRGPGVLRELENVNDFTTGVRSNYVRVLETTANGPVVLVPVAERRAVAAGVASARAAIADALCVYYPISAAGAPGASPDCWSTAQVVAGRAVSTADGHVFGLAPDGVGSVSIAVGGPGPVSARVADNFFDVGLPPSSGTASVGGRADVGGVTRPPARPVVTFSGRSAGSSSAARRSRQESSAHAPSGP